MIVSEIYYLIHFIFCFIYLDVRLHSYRHDGHGLHFFISVISAHFIVRNVGGVKINMLGFRKGVNQR